MLFDSEKEIYKIWRQLHAAQDEIGKTYMRWRQILIEILGDKVNPLDVSIKCSQKMGKEISKSWLPRLSFAKGEEFWLKGLTQNYLNWWKILGAVIEAKPGKDSFEVFLEWKECPWPTFCKKYGVSMEEDVLSCDAFFKETLKDINLFFNVNYKIETIKTIPRGQGVCVRRLFKDK